MTHIGWEAREARDDADLLANRERKLRAVVDTAVAAPDADGLLLRLFSTFPRGNWQIEVGHTHGSFDVTVTDGAGGIVGYAAHRSFLQALTDLCDDRLAGVRSIGEARAAHPSSRAQRWPAGTTEREVVDDLAASGAYDDGGDVA